LRGVSILSDFSCVGRVLIGCRQSALGHEDAFPPPRLSGGCGFSQRAFVGTWGNGQDAPKPAVHRMSETDGTRPVAVIHRVYAERPIDNLCWSVLLTV
jgi:hypothetical protein